jgi:membrane protein
MPYNSIRTLRYVGEVLSVSARHFHRERALEAAATISFFAIFSLFPLLLVLTAIGGSLVNALQAEERIVDLIVNLFPIERGLIKTNLTHLVDVRGAVSLIGLVVLLWAATSAFDALVRNINRAWADRPRRGIIRTRLAALAFVGVLVALLALLLLAKAALDVVTQRMSMRAADTFLEVLHSIPSNLMFFVAAFFILLALYRLVPSARVRLYEATVGAAIAAAAFVASTDIFSWYLGSGFARYNAVYGSLGAFLAFLSWVYIVTLITLGGAHLAAGIGACSRKDPGQNAVPRNDANRPRVNGYGQRQQHRTDTEKQRP